jgi:phosphate ABC transporter phosphate-binding protein
MRRSLILLALWGVLGGGLATAAPASAEGPLIHGAGSTWVQIAMNQWASDVSRFGLQVDYQGTGSTAGRQNYMYNLIDFAATEIPYQPDELAQYHNELGDRFRTWQYLPDVAGGTAFMYNLVDDATGQRITNLRLSGEAVAKIFTGQVTRWRDPIITGDNPGLNLPDQALTPVVRSDSSGTSAQLSLYLAAIASGTWGGFASARGCPAPCQNWPTDRPFVGQNLSSGVTNYVASTPGTINYVEAGYALAKGYPVAYVRNGSGNFAVPLSQNVATALVHAHLNADLTQDLGGVYVAPEANAYPVSSYSYMIAPTSKIDADKGAVLGKFILYAVCAGQKAAPLLGYSPLPPNLVQIAFDAVNRINGHPPTPDLSTQAGRDACPNPTFQKSATEIQGAALPGTSKAAGGSGAIAGRNGAAAGTLAAGASVARTGAAGSTTAASALTADGALSAAGAAGAAAVAGSDTSVNLAYARRKAVLGSLRHVQAPNSTPLVLASFYLPLLVFLPLLVRRKRSAP